ncbi:hypothetical protein LJ655_00410 [Paraburkholderia sp. MMS20-SJTN17]|uniref:Uncharacterized protein n=1 Tax=Paraburkholderia translucens TaxID=2886945 RepID=A0ABS8K6K6_9BURK|nr:hypothetical protein [Paraburkholderia sp. MMS20-SJTN17]MCC8400365.1 hypothetical protein [Paraburkholderia sp. MMS20-SJTN17]
MATDLDDTDLRQSAADGRHSGFDRDGPVESGASPPRFGRLALCLAAAGALTFGVVGTVAYGVWFNEDQQTYTEAIAGAREALGSPASRGAPTVAVAHAPDQSVAQPVSQAVSQSASQPAAQSVAQSPAPFATQPTAPEVALEATSAFRGFNANNATVWFGPVLPRSPDPSLSPTLADTSADTPPDASIVPPADTPAAPIAPAPRPRSTKHGANTAASNARPAAAHGAKDTRLAQQERRASPKHKDNLFARIGQFFRRVSYRQHENGRQQQDPYSHP